IVTRPHELREDARRARVPRRERASVCSARVVVPLVTAVVTISGTALASSLLGLSVWPVLAISAVVAVVGAIVAHRTTSNVLSGAVRRGRRLRAISAGVRTVGIQYEVRLHRLVVCPRSCGQTTRLRNYPLTDSRDLLRRPHVCGQTTRLRNTTSDLASSATRG